MKVMKKKNALAMPITMSSIKKERRKTISRRMIREKGKRGKKIKRFGLRRNFQNFINLVILSGCS